VVVQIEIWKATTSAFFISMKLATMIDVTADSPSFGASLTDT